MRTDATRAIPKFIPEIHEESTLVINKALKYVNGEGTVPLNLSI